MTSRFPVQQKLTGTTAVTGETTLVDLVVTGNTTVQSITINGKIITQGSAPTAVLGATTGDGASANIDGNDTAGTIEYTTGMNNLPTYPLSAGEQVTVDFTSDYAEAPKVAITPKNAGSAGIKYYVTTTTTGFILHFVDQPAELQNYSFDYIVIQ